MVKIWLTSSGAWKKNPLLVKSRFMNHLDLIDNPCKHFRSNLHFEILIFKVQDYRFIWDIEVTILNLKKSFCLFTWQTIRVLKSTSSLQWRIHPVFVLCSLKALTSLKNKLAQWPRRFPKQFTSVLGMTAAWTLYPHRGNKTAGWLLD